MISTTGTEKPADSPNKAVVVCDLCKASISASPILALYATNMDTIRNIYYHLWIIYAAYMILYWPYTKVCGRMVDDIEGWSADKFSTGQAFV